MQGRIFPYKELEYYKHTKENTTHRTLHTKVWQEKDKFTLENIFLYNPQKDRDLNTSKKEVKNDGTSSQPNPKKISPKYPQWKLVVKINFGIKIYIKAIQQGKFYFSEILVS